MYKRIAIIGVGTLGGFLAKCISRLSSVEQITIIDYDVVDKKNLVNHVYSENDVATQKVDALFKILKSSKSGLKVRRIRDKYIEGETKLPPSDLVIDCRDFTYDRGDKIDVRAYMSSRYLIVDCRKNVKYDKHHEGKYLTELTKLDIEIACLNFTNLIESNHIEKLIKNQMVYKIFLDHVKEEVDTEIFKTKDCSELVLDSHLGDKQLTNIHEVESLLKLNKEYDTVLCIGDKTNSLLTQEFEKDSFSDFNELISTMLSFIDSRKNMMVYQNFIISPIVVNKICYIQLLPETGAA